MEDMGQLTALRTGSSPVVAALAAARSQRFLSMPDLVRAGFKDSTAPIISIGHFHGLGNRAGLAQPSPPFENRHPNPGATGRDVAALLEDGAALLDPLRLTAAADAARLFGFVEAADFAGRIEEISRSLEYLQVVAAQAVERTRKEAQQASPGSSAGAPEWRTGWTEPATRATVTGTASFLDDGYRNAAEFLRARLRISIGEARRRLALAPDVLPQTGMAGQEIPARREVLAEALSSALVPSRSATIISSALEKVRLLTDDGTINRMEHALTATALESDPDFVTKMAKRWVDSIDQDGPEPSEEVLRQLQGAFFRHRRRHGLHHIEIFATAEQYETLATAMNTATNPRLTTGHSTITGEGGGTNNATGEGDESDDGSRGGNNETGNNETTGPELDRRSRPMKLLDGLVGACAVAMTTGKLPANGGLRPQLTLTIDERDLFERRTDHQRLSSGTATFVGPMHPNTIRKIACDADILPVLLGTDSRVLDIGRTTRIFPPHIRKAITARDGGCAFPDCTMPAPWCEAHHITY
ncbi:DUF222 domain-containing protein, partial [Paenarthrobacter sp. RAF54_2]|uniref:DUF222 domain-containing protein n=1 Tax=Paenarthrobacter sp. RAF54_2 TaxID=3233061 RepID=UPI003F94ED19